MFVVVLKEWKWIMIVLRTWNPREIIVINKLNKIVHVIMIYAFAQQKNNNKDNDDLCKKECCFTLTISK
jgi:hypothetical protein